MVLIRSLLFEAFFLLSVVLYATLILLIRPFVPFLWLAWLGRQWARLNLGALAWLCGLRYRVEGLERLPREACVLLCKHQSTWETIALRALLPLEQTWVLKRELMTIPFFGWALRCFEPIAIDRAEGARSIKQLVREGTRALEGGRWVVVFPEGTRVAVGERRPYAVGGALLAARTARPVVPVAHNAGHFWARRALRKYPGTIDMVFGDPLASEGLSAKALNARAEAWIEARVAELDRRA
ncbi:MAG: 1-acyl-sn-glycerol-3-phosphate acyltransferase [Chromatiaceae bacterium]|nr:1-acyl-sn-glycerol-3-phosphate acyltransferase [Chromatiaceae bacterium]